MSLLSRIEGIRVSDHEEPQAIDEAVLAQAITGSPEARDKLINTLYPQLRASAARMLRYDASVLTLQPTELVHEAAMRLIRLDRLRWQDRAHFLAICSRVMRQVIVDQARRVRANKRQHLSVTTSWLKNQAAPEPIDAEALDQALTRLAEVSPERAQIVELRFFVGLDVREIAHVTQTSERTVKRHWQSARAWLLEALTAPQKS